MAGAGTVLAKSKGCVESQGLVGLAARVGPEGGMPTLPSARSSC